MTTILVYGWYNRGNVGDELMAQSLRAMFEPYGIKLVTVEVLTEKQVSEAQGVIFGGGGMLRDAPVAEPAALDLLQRNLRPCFYLGVGLEAGVHDVHKQLMGVARIVAVRHPGPVPFARQVHEVPDLVYYLGSDRPPAQQTGKGVLIIPNVEVLPTWSDPHWMHVAWERFKDEFAQALDICVADLKLRPAFMLMCKNPRQDDRWPAHELLARMKHRSTDYNVLQAPVNHKVLEGLIQEFEVVVTQRYHGIVLSQMAGVPVVSIDHHDKLKNAWPRKGINVAYHGATKQQLLEAVELSRKTPREQTRIPKEMYDDIIRVIADIVREGSARV